ncbi:thermonuclease family protein [Ensifer aridi]|uniref:thermonuclease family protein n=1 Tax=Ensifer aridi TaxID=1708715 RepID=UPI000A10F058|nr:thermonuclease family protein [Ensifer aridi]
MNRTGSAAEICGKKAPSRSLLALAIRRVRAALAWFLLSQSAAASEALIGYAFVIDGDTIEIAGERIQLNGVDAPEAWQVCLGETGTDYRCGKESASALDTFLSASRPTRCEFVARDRYGRFVGTCFRADGKDVNRWLVQTGNAIDRGTYGSGLYDSAQQMARSIGAGIWRGRPDRTCAARPGRVNQKPTC